jgi:hypothetical protein
MSGYRLPRPDSCPETVYDIMMTCWKESPRERPVFRDIAELLRKLYSELNVPLINSTYGTKPETTEQVLDHAYVDFAKGGTIVPQRSTIISTSRANAAQPAQPNPYAIARLMTDSSIDQTTSHYIDVSIDQTTSHYIDVSIDQTTSHYIDVSTERENLPVSAFEYEQIRPLPISQASAKMYESNISKETADSSLPEMVCGACIAPVSNIRVSASSLANDVYLDISTRLTDDDITGFDDIQ